MKLFGKLYIVIFIFNKIRFFTKKIKINSSKVSVKAQIGNNCLIMQGTVIDEYTQIGKYSYIGNYCYLTKSKIGNYCSIANNVSIGQGEHDLTKISTNSIFYKNAFEELTKNECVIGNDVWIGVDCIIKRGVKIGNGAVIGANSVVTKDIPDFAIAVGSPAQIIKYRFDDKKIKQINLSNWWEKDKIEAEKIIEGLS